MPTPLTTGQFRRKLSDLQIGDYIACKYTATSGAAGTFSNLGASLSVAQANEIPVAGTATPNGYFYLLKADYGLLIADRSIQNSVAVDTLNAAGLVCGKPFSYEMAGVTSNFSNVSPTYDGDINNIFDGDISTYWQPNAVSGAFTLVYDEPISIKKITTRTTFCSNISISHSNDNSNFTTIGTLTGTEDTNLTEKSISADVSCKYLKFSFSAGGFYPVVKDIVINPKDVLARILSGGSAYMGADSLPKSADAGLGGWPSFNEWDKYIFKSSLGGRISPADDNVWHYMNNWTAVKETPIVAINTSANRVFRGYYSAPTFSPTTSSLASSNLYFRPAIEFLESDSKAATLWY